MKKLLAALLLTPTIAFSSNAFHSGNSLLSLMNGSVDDRIQALGYVQGAIDAYSGIIICAPAGSAGVTTGQANDMIKNYLTNTPAERHYSASSIIRKSFGELWPCKKSNNL